MRWFSRSWAEGSEEADDDVISAYQGHLAAIWSGLPSGLRDLARPRDARMSMHDAAIQSFEIDKPEKKVRLVLRTGRLPEGYGMLDLGFGGASFQPPLTELPEHVLRDPLTRLGYEEIDVDLSATSAPYILRILFFPEGELALRFRTIKTRFSPLASSENRPNHDRRS